MSNFKTIDEEIQYLGNMIGATRAGDAERLKTIGSKLIQLSVNLTGTDNEHCMCNACKDGVRHSSDCAVHNMPAYPNGKCDCIISA